MIERCHQRWAVMTVGRPDPPLRLFLILRDCIFDLQPSIWFSADIISTEYVGRCHATSRLFVVDSLGRKWDSQMRLTIRSQDLRHPGVGQSGIAMVPCCVERYKRQGSISRCVTTMNCAAQSVWTDGCSIIYFLSFTHYLQEPLQNKGQAHPSNKQKPIEQTKRKQNTEDSLIPDNNSESDLSYYRPTCLSGSRCFAKD
ncbi:hypothetical protein BC832DRAFT_108515 [Gaertneriomyces semiglobifer]|nr:hypothetical protein BC832DRAFT_108515 [Gaertneriomyces semiglobifer]